MRGEIKTTVIGYIQLDTWDSKCPYICYGLMSEEYMNFVVGHNKSLGYTTKIETVYETSSVCKRIEQLIEEF